jgi:hypothetical protein
VAALPRSSTLKNQSATAMCPPALAPTRRARYIGQLWRVRETRHLAELLIDLEMTPWARSLVIEMLRTRAET